MGQRAAPVANRHIVRRSAGQGVEHRRRRSPIRLPHLSTPWLSLAMLVGALGLFFAAAFWVWQSPIFEVKHIAIEGSDRIPVEALGEKSSLLGENMFTADLAGAQERLYALPLVKSARVSRDWPNTIKITIEERTVWGTWEQSGVRYSIDREGVVLGTNGAPKGSPVIKSSQQGSRIQGERVDYQAVEAAAEIYEQLPRQLGTSVTEVAFVAGKGVQVRTADNQSALLGDSSSIPYKLSVWAAMAKQAKASGINYTTIDLRFGNRPVMQ